MKIYIFLFNFRIKKLLNERKAKSERENGMIYHARLPEVGREGFVST